MPLSVSDDLRYLKGVGDARIKLYNKLGVYTVEDLLYHLPRSYIDLRNPQPPEAAPIGELCAVSAIVSHKSGEQRIRKGLSVFKVRAVGATASLEATWYNAKYTVAALREGEEYIFYGRVGGGLLRREMQSPAVYPASARGLVAVYPATAGLTSRMISANVHAVLNMLESIPETLPPGLLARHNLPPLEGCLRRLHSPADFGELEQARRRLEFEELFCLGLGLAAMRQKRVVAQIEPMQPRNMEDFYRKLPFTPTAGQMSAIGDSLRDMCSGLPMSRLVQGDVGSGKTLVAAACCYFAFLNGFGSAMMAPTELLAAQHCRALTDMLEPLGLRVGLLTGSMTAKQKRLVKDRLASGELDVITGTHALLTADTVWSRLGLVITDEQHRFGVAQRMSLTQKGAAVHTLVMSATPIPRTLGLIVYGDMELSVIHELPVGRQPVETFLIDSAKRHRAFGYIKKHLERGLQGFIVCPLVEDDPELPDQNKKSATEWLNELQKGEFTGWRLGLLHGKMKPRDKDAVMSAFAAGELDLLVSTTVIEVGIDVPNAAIIMIENAESFGLSQLHQLRGRVGRGREKSTCILLSDNKTPETLERLRTLCSTSDGFAIAEYDLAVRGPGDFFGLRQHGIPSLHIASLVGNSAMLEETRDAAANLYADNPELVGLPLIKRRVDRMMSAAGVL